MVSDQKFASAEGQRMFQQNDIRQRLVAEKAEENFKKENKK